MTWAAWKSSCSKRETRRRAIFRGYHAPALDIQWPRCYNVLMARTKIRQVGNSRGIVIPADLLEHLGLEEGTEVDLVADANRLVVRESTGDREEFIRALEVVLEENDEILADLAER